ncbi:hypothetical protein H8356DRAFT_1730641 [Neocallimastix lanati (nom. inval.)]|uniref:Uncharacterized protein n=1 Tax=Neocallimastix californiae TaxID=1754190 RepID=A0A1Y2C2Q4_9FUNG|nr:hypothetical protein H8356DRAFT_1730641 [Neocallimastix sp. JGI-2020a]ORY40595.1 hypothetical protein LY90DRAFT_704099 [Neocallimastix californiae]|eukprot:ORY40595.1 hypothetical protein LY90DRAFT_704099 [Neocallimastix californiae]
MGFLNNIKDSVIILLLGVAAIIIDTKNPDVVKWVRIIYYGIHAINLIAILIVHINILVKGQKEKFTYTRITSVLGAAAGEGEVKVISIPIAEYDLIQKNALLRSNLIILVILTITHVLFGWTKPLLLQVYFPLKLLLIHPLFRVHLLQREAKGNLARPWDMYYRIPLSTIGDVIRERPTIPRDIKKQKKESMKQSGEKSKLKRK